MDGRNRDGVPYRKWPTSFIWRVYKYLSYDLPQTGIGAALPSAVPSLKSLIQSTIQGVLREHVSQGVFGRAVPTANFDPLRPDLLRISGDQRYEILYVNLADLTAITLSSAYNEVVLPKLPPRLYLPDHILGDGFSSGHDLLRRYLLYNGIELFPLGETGALTRNHIPGALQMILPFGIYGRSHLDNYTADFPTGFDFHRFTLAEILPERADVPIEQWDAWARSVLPTRIEAQISS